jgi:HEAT repeat protein
MGAAEALAGIGDERATRPLVSLVHREKHPEIAWAGVLALGEIGSPDAVPDLVLLLQDWNKFIRYGAARSLEKLGWEPAGTPDRIRYLIAVQDWELLKTFGPAAVRPLSGSYRDADPGTRERIIALLGEIGDPDAHGTCQAGLRDRDPGVRWTAVLASMNCGIRSLHLPPLVANRERTGPDPLAAALLNFLFLGIGYNYIGKWWGFPVFMTYMSVMVLAQLYAGPFLPYLVAYPVTAVLGVHTYYLADRMSEL